MVYNTRNCQVFGPCPSSGILKKLEYKTFRKLDQFPSSGEGGSLRANLNHWRQFPIRCVLWFLEYRTIDQAQKPSNSEL
jgi:hypothetical protein